MHNYYVYILKCSDGSFYTGVTNNAEKRLEEHQQGINTNCYTFSRRPLEMVYYEHTTDINIAIAREKQIKGWSRRKKIALIEQNFEQLIEFSLNSVRSNSNNL
jgi:putative endonuclease